MSIHRQNTPVTPIRISPRYNLTAIVTKQQKRTKFVLAIVIRALLVPSIYILDCWEGQGIFFSITQANSSTAIYCWFGVKFCNVFLWYNWAQKYPVSKLTTWERKYIYFRAVRVVFLRPFPSRKNSERKPNNKLMSEHPNDEITDHLTWHIKRNDMNKIGFIIRVKYVVIK